MIIPGTVRPLWLNTKKSIKSASGIFSGTLLVRISLGIITSFYLCFLKLYRGTNRLKRGNHCCLKTHQKAVT